VHFIKQPGTQTIRDRNTGLNLLFNEIRALIVNDESQYNAGRNQLFLLIQRLRQIDCEVTVTPDVVDVTETQSARYIGTVSEYNVQDPPVPKKRGRSNITRTKSRGEQSRKRNRTERE